MSRRLSAVRRTRGRGRRPHCTPLLAVWYDGALHGGLDLIVEGVAERITDHDRLRDLAAVWEEKYGPEWHFDVGEGGFIQRGSPGVLVFRIAPTTAFGFGKAPYSQTRWRF